MNSFKDVNRQINSANMLMEGVKITIVGDVNVGKSTLMNILTEKDTSIVSDIKGTTRDIVKYRAEISGVPVVQKKQKTKKQKPPKGNFVSAGLLDFAIFSAGLLGFAIHQ